MAEQTAEKKENFFIKHRKTTALVLGLAAAFGFAPSYAVLVTLCSLLAAFVLTDKMQNLRQVAAVGYWYGFGMFAAGFYWIGNALLIDVAAFGWLYPFALFGAGAFFGLFTIVPFMLWHQFSALGVWHKIVAFAAAWVLMEWVRSFILTGFPWNPLGSVFAFHPVWMQTASLWGVYGLSFLAVCLAGSLYVYCYGQKRGAVVFFAMLLFMMGFGAWRVGQYKPYAGEITVRLVQPSIPQQMKWKREILEENFAAYIEMSRQKPLTDIDFVIWGETAIPFDLDRDWRHLQQLKGAVPPQGYLIGGMVRFDGEKAYNSLYVFNEEGGVEGFYDKSHLVPFGEYIPLRKYLPEWIKPVAANMADFGAGKKYKNIKIGDYPIFGALICYEIIFPGEVVNPNERPSWLVVLSNDGWYGNSTGPHQHLAAAQMRAVEEGVTVVRSANSGISAVINPVGQVVASLPLNEEGILDVRLPHYLQISTFYSRCKNIPIFFSIVLILSALIIYVRLISANNPKNS